MIEETVVLAGLGGIGSHVALCGIARVGCRYLILYDRDVLEARNLDNQAYYTWDLDPEGPVFKVDAAREYLEHLPEGRIGRIESRREWADRDPAKYRGIVISAVDSLEARCEIFQGVRHHPRVSLYIECAAASRIGIVYALDPRDMDAVEWYERTLRFKPPEDLAACVDPDAGPIFGGLVGNILAEYAESSWRNRMRVRITEFTLQDHRPFMQTYEILPGERRVG